jgi:hypothetical protein
MVAPSDIRAVGLTSPGLLEQHYSDIEFVHFVAHMMQLNYGLSRKPSKLLAEFRMLSRRQSALRTPRRSVSRPSMLISGSMQIVLQAMDS